MFKSGVDEIEKKIYKDYKFQKQVEDGYFIDYQTEVDNSIKKEQDLFNGVKNNIVVNEVIPDNSYEFNNNTNYAELIEIDHLHTDSDNTDINYIKNLSNT